MIVVLPDHIHLLFLTKTPLHIERLKEFWPKPFCVKRGKRSFGLNAFALREA